MRLELTQEQQPLQEVNVDRFHSLEMKEREPGDGLEGWGNLEDP